MPRSRSLLVIGLLSVVAAIVGGVAGTHWLRTGSPDRAAATATVGGERRTAASTTPADPSAPPRRLPGPSLFVAPGGNDGGDCSAADPCRSFDRAYHVARPGQVVQLAGGDY